MTPRIAQVQVNLFCDDLMACLAFYESLGLVEAFRAPASGPADHIEVAAADVRIGLTSAEAANRLAGLGVGTGSGVATELVLWCDRVDEMHALALASGAREVAPPMDSPDARIRYSWVGDPDGHQVKFVQAL